jgi:hypothetical protein
VITQIQAVNNPSLLELAFSPEVRQGKTDENEVQQSSSGKISPLRFNVLKMLEGNSPLKLLGQLRRKTQSHSNVLESKWT